MTQVFVSHAEADKALVDEFVKEILNAGCGISDPFQSSSVRLGAQPGTSIFSTIEKELREADAVVALISGSALESPYVTAEIGAAWMLSTSQQERSFIPLLVPPVKIEDVGGILPHVKDLRVDEAEHLDSLRKLLVPERDNTDPVWIDARARWLAWLSEHGSGKPPLTDQVEWFRLLRDSARDSHLNEDTLLRYAKRTSQDISFSGGSMAVSIQSTLTVRYAEENDYWLYDLSTVTEYRGLTPGIRQHHNVTIEPIAQVDLGGNGNDEEPDVDTPFTGEPWLVHLAPVLRDMADWERFRDDVEVTMIVWAGERLENKTRFDLQLQEANPADPESPEPRELAEKEEASPRAGRILYSTQDLDVPTDWERISFEFRNIPHTVAQPAMYFFAPDLCEADWRFTAQSDTRARDLEVRASAMTSWRDVAMSQGTIGDNRGTVAVLRPRGTLLLAQDAVLVTLHSPSPTPA